MASRFRFLEGKRDQYLRLSARALEYVRANEPDTLQYDLYLNDDQTECLFIERYQDSDAAMQHARNLADIFAEVLSIVEVVHGELLGEPSAELRANLAGSDVPAVFTPYSKMTRE